MADNLEQEKKRLARLLREVVAIDTDNGTMPGSKTLDPQKFLKYTLDRYRARNAFDADYVRDDFNPFDEIHGQIEHIRQYQGKDDPSKRDVAAGNALQEFLNAESRTIIAALRDLEQQKLVEAARPAPAAKAAPDRTAYATRFKDKLPANLDPKDAAILNSMANGNPSPETNAKQEAIGQEGIDRAMQDALEAVKDNPAMVRVLKEQFAKAAAVKPNTKTLQEEISQLRDELRTYTVKSGNITPEQIEAQIAKLPKTIPRSEPVRQ